MKPFDFSFVVAGLLCGLLNYDLWFLSFQNIKLVLEVKKFLLKLLVQLLKFLRGKLNVFECLGFDHFDILGESQSKHALFDAPHIGVDRANEGCLGVASETLLKQSR